MQEYTIKFYEKADGSKPIENFLNELDIRMRAKMMREIQLLKTNGPSLRMPHSRFLEDGIFELRAQMGSNICRSLYFFYSGKNIILTNGFVKKSQKTPPKEIALAKEYRGDYIARVRGDLNG